MKKKKKAARKRSKKKIEYKKIAFAAISIFSLVYISVGRALGAVGIEVDPSTDTALIYVVLTGYIAYCTASASDKHNRSKYGELPLDKKEGDGTE